MVIRESSSPKCTNISNKEWNSGLVYQHHCGWWFGWLLFTSSLLGRGFQDRNPQNLVNFFFPKFPKISRFKQIQDEQTSTSSTIHWKKPEKTNSKGLTPSYPCFFCNVADRALERIRQEAILVHGEGWPQSIANSPASKLRVLTRDLQNYAFVAVVVRFCCKKSFETHIPKETQMLSTYQYFTESVWDSNLPLPSIHTHILTTFNTAP